MYAINVILFLINLFDNIFFKIRKKQHMSDSDITSTGSVCVRL